MTARAESQWLYRRIFTWTLTLALLAAIVVCICLMPATDLKQIALALIALVALIVTYYLLAPSAPELARLLEAALARISFGRPAQPDSEKADLP